MTRTTDSKKTFAHCSINIIKLLLVEKGMVQVLPLKIIEAKKLLKKGSRKRIQQRKE